MSFHAVSPLCSAVCHVGAVLVISLAIVTDMPVLARIGAGLGLAGALAFAAFVSFVVLRLRPSRQQAG